MSNFKLYCIMCNNYVVFYENLNTGFIGVVGFTSDYKECDKLIDEHYSGRKLNYVYHTIPNLPNVMYKFYTIDKLVNIRYIFDKLLINQCCNVGNCLSFADLALKKNHLNNSLHNYKRALILASDTSILDNYSIC